MSAMSAPPARLNGWIALVVFLAALTYLFISAWRRSEESRQRVARRFIRLARDARE